MANNQQLTLALRIRADLNDAQDALRRLNGNVDELGQSTRTAARDADQLNAATQRIGGGMTALLPPSRPLRWGWGAVQHSGDHPDHRRLDQPPEPAAPGHQHPGSTGGGDR
ncbi:hypothetical protein I3251_30320 [Pseudomonas aeruginosa]|uniref:hypothetical protein n=1 Tax=Pseudomonas aeruginosa TaxID=287 RepID=UPI001BB0A90C|nr:hypothetical protein [Pseudomonas aeruginosa]QUI40371.1 hypothetical protein I3251_30320 [Pseudomonas aeruginosa]